MKTLIHISILLMMSIVYAQNYNFLGDYTSDGTPLYLVASDIVSVETQEMIANVLPEGYPVPDYNPQYISSGYDTDLILDDNADVWVTFVLEGAGYRNVLGFYTYDVDSPLTTAPQPEDITIVFPNVSAKGSGGGLEIGNKVKIGTFEAGTAIGWVLFANGWQNGAVTDGLWQVYSNPVFNPESNEDLQYHNVLLKDEENERIILGFEDVRRDYASCDNDFNDAIFYVTANPYTAIRTTNVVGVETASTEVTSANNGGLESNGNLANLIAKRNFKRKQTGSASDKIAMQPRFSKANILLGGQNNSLNGYLPETGMRGTESVQISSPNDLIEVTNATEIFSIDVYDESKRVAAALATATTGNVYDHSKAICDRLNGSSLEDVRTVDVRGHEVISSKIIRSHGEVEYTLSFSIKLNDQQNELFSFWNIDQYPPGDYYNFQIWGNSFSQVFAIANHILDTLMLEKTLTSSDMEDKIPTVFVKSGMYKQGALHLNIVNKVKATAVIFQGNMATTEVSGRNEQTEVVTLSGNWNDELIVETGGLFDIGFSLSHSTSTQKDALYLADGPWGMDYMENFVTVDEFEVTHTTIDFDTEAHHVERDVMVSGQVKGTFNMFRHLLPGDQVLEVGDYNAIEFNIQNTKPVEVILMTDAITDWNKRLRTTIQPNNTRQKQVISFDDFVDEDGNTIALETVRTVVFSVQGDYSTYTSFVVDLQNVALKQTETLSVEENEIVYDRFKNYPNPFQEITTFELIKSTRSISIQVFDVMGRLVDQQQIKTNNGHTVKYIAPTGLNGIYHYHVKDDSGQTYQGKFIVY